MNVTTPILLPHADMRSSESNALQEGGDVQRYELPDNWTDAVIAVTPPQGFTTQVRPNMCCRSLVGIYITSDFLLHLMKFMNFLIHVYTTYCV